MMVRADYFAENPILSMNSDHSGLSNWYVFKTKPHAEFQVDSLLGSQQITAYLPLLKHRDRCVPFFPGYLFARVDLSTDQYMRSRSAPGVSYILCTDGVPVPVAEDLVEEIRQRVNLKNNIGPASKFAHGERVVVTTGPFSGLDALFDRVLTPQGRCEILLRILGQMTRVQVSAEHLTRVNA